MALQGLHHLQGIAYLRTALNALGQSIQGPEYMVDYE